MFRNPRENRKLPPSAKLQPSVGRSPSPPRSSTSSNAPPMATKPASKATKPPMSTPTSSKPRQTQTTLVPQDWGKRLPANGVGKGKPKGTPNGNIMSFFKKAEEINNRLFFEERGAKVSINVDDSDEESIPKVDESRYNEKEGSVKRRKIEPEELATETCTPPPPAGDEETKEPMPAHEIRAGRRRTGPFVDDSDSEADEMEAATTRRPLIQPEMVPDDSVDRDSSMDMKLPLLQSEPTFPSMDNDFEDFGDVEDDDLLEGEEYDERRWMAAQRELEMVEAGFEGDPDDFEPTSLFPDNNPTSADLPIEALAQGAEATQVEALECPVCNHRLVGYSESETSAHVNACLDGNPQPIKEKGKDPGVCAGSKMFKKPARPAKEAQQNPFQLGGEPGLQTKSAFSTLMASHAEDAAWATAAASDKAARGKPAFQRTCPFYKILPGFYIAVDAFRYGAVKGQNAYFLSHFHSDHYIGLTSSWSHGPIYCSKVTGNLVRQQLRVNPQWVVDLEFEKKTEVPGTQGVYVTMIPANHCPGSSLFLFEKQISKGANLKQQRVLHCGDFRACQAHIEHPLLRPEVLDAVSGKSRQQKLDVCYLDTTYLNPKYAFPPQQQVIQACADMCVSLNKVRADETDGWEQMKRDRAGQGMVKFVRKSSDVKQDEEEEKDEDIDAMKVTVSGTTNKRGRLLVIVGTYSIGKERICLGIAKALGSKIYAPPNKQRICHALEDPELNALLTKDPREAQVHMTPLFEIRAETLEDYLRDYRDTFSRAVGFRPSGWNYRPPNSRFTESPAVSTVLHSSNWKSQFSMRDLTPQRGSTSRASCFGVPYSEHSSFRELTMFCCALRIDKIIPTVNVGSAKSREKMKAWCERWAVEKKKNGLFRLGEDGAW